MKSLLVNYLNSRRSVHIQETIVDVDVATTSAANHHSIDCHDDTSDVDDEEIKDESAATICRDSTFLDLNLKFIDDNDTDDSTALSSSPSSSHRSNLADFDLENCSNSTRREASYLAMNDTGCKLTKSNLRTCRNCKYAKVLWKVDMTVKFENRSQNKKIFNKTD
jgi:hypothetical protein